MVQGIGQDEQPRHLAVGIRAQLVAHGLHAFGGPQVDINDDPGKVAGGPFGNFRGRDGVDLADGLQDTGQFAALIVAVRGQQKPAPRRLVG